MGQTTDTHGSIWTICAGRLSYLEHFFASSAGCIMIGRIKDVSIQELQNTASKRMSRRKNLFVDFV